jgi:hypothetical protein
VEAERPAQAVVAWNENIAARIRQRQRRASPNRCQGRGAIWTGQVTGDQEDAELEGGGEGVNRFITWSIVTPFLSGAESKLMGTQPAGSTGLVVKGLGTSEVRFRLPIPPVFRPWPQPWISAASSSPRPLRSPHRPRTVPGTKFCDWVLISTVAPAIQGRRFTIKSAGKDKASVQLMMI